MIKAIKAKGTVVLSNDITTHAKRIYLTSLLTYGKREYLNLD